MPKFLIIRFSSIGDIILTTPVVRCLKQQVPGAEIYYLTKSVFADVLSGNPHIDYIYKLEDDLSDLISEMKRVQFDAIIDLHHNQRSWFVKNALKRPSFSFHKLNIEKWLMVNLKINRLPKAHIVDRSMDVIKSWDIKYDGAGLDFFISPEAVHVTEKLPLIHQMGFIAFVIGAKHNTKQLPVEKIISICNQINYPIVLVGGSVDAEKGDLIANACDEHVFSACGKTSLHESAELIRQAKHVITHDTGMMHIAAALGKKIISVWGNTIPEFGMYPYYSDAKGGADAGMKTVVEVKNLNCRPCSKIGFQKCPKGHLNCLNLIDESEILKLL